MQRWIAPALVAALLAFGIAAGPVAAVESSPEPFVESSDPQGFGPFCFDVNRPGSRGQRDAVRASFAASDYPWSATVPYVHRWKGSAGCMTVQFRPCSCAGEWLPGWGLRIAEDLTPERAGRVFQSEAAHFADYATLTPGYRGELFAAAHDGDLSDHDDHCWLRACSYRNQVGESLMRSYAAAFAPSWATSYSSFTHALDPAVTRRVLLAAAADQEGGVFTDVPPEHAHREAIERMAGLRVVSGYRDGTFRPNEPVSRAQVAAMLSRLLDHVEATR